MNQNMSFYKGLYLSPAVVCSSLKTMTFASLMLEKLGFDVDPKYDEYRTDVIQTITLNDPDKMVKFCQGIQSACPVESYVSPIPSDMPGYNHQVVMASGSFTEGSTIELSCDGPVIPPYTIFMQGGLTYEYGKLGILLALNKILNK